MGNGFGRSDSGAGFSGPPPLNHFKSGDGAAETFNMARKAKQAGNPRAVTPEPLTITSDADLESPLGRLKREQSIVREVLAELDAVPREDRLIIRENSERASLVLAHFERLRQLFARHYRVLIGALKAALTDAEYKELNKGLTWKTAESPRAIDRFGLPATLPDDQVDRVRTALRIVDKRLAWKIAELEGAPLPTAPLGSEARRSRMRGQTCRDNIKRVVYAERKRDWSLGDIHLKTGSVLKTVVNECCKMVGTGELKRVRKGVYRAPPA